MGTVFSSLSGSRKRPRNARSGERSPVDDDDDAHDRRDSPESECPDESSPFQLADHLRRLRYRVAPAVAVGKAVCQCVATDAAMQTAYGCHAHVYETASPAESHGVALAWCVEDGVPLSPLALLSLCRVANSCRKKTLVTSPNGAALILTYAATL